MELQVNAFNYYFEANFLFFLGVIRQESEGLGE